MQEKAALDKVIDDGCDSFELNYRNTHVLELLNRCNCLAIRDTDRP
jgi:hypothetical protein